MSIAAGTAAPTPVRRCAPEALGRPGRSAGALPRPACLAKALPTTRRARRQGGGMAQQLLSEQRRWIGRRDGRPGFDVTALGFGAATISNHHPSHQLTEAEAVAAVAAAHDTGVRFFDTAPWCTPARPS